VNGAEVSGEAQGRVEDQTDSETQWSWPALVGAMLAISASDKTTKNWPMYA